MTCLLLLQTATTATKVNEGGPCYVLTIYDSMHEAMYEIVIRTVNVLVGAQGNECLHKEGKMEDAKRGKKG